MPETTVFASKADNRAAQLGAAAGQGIASALEDKLMHMANMKAEKVRSAHIKTLYPKASQAQLEALSALGPRAEENFFKGISALQNVPNQVTQINTPEDPKLNFGGIQNTNISPTNNELQSSDNEKFQPIDSMNALGRVGIHMTPAQSQNFSKLPVDIQEKIVDDVYSKLPPKQQRQMEDFYNQVLAKDLGEKKNDQVSNAKTQPQQIIGNTEPGVGPQQIPQKLDVGQALSSGISGSTPNEENNGKPLSASQIKQRQELNFMIKSTNDIDKSLDDIEDLIDNGDVKTGKIAQSFAENGLLHNITPDTASLYQAIQDLLVKQQTALSSGGRSSDTFRDTIASAKINLAQPIPVMRRTLKKIREANDQERKDLIDIREGRQINKREKPTSQQKPSRIVKSLSEAKVKEGARARDSDTGQWFTFINGKWEPK